MSLTKKMGDAHEEFLVGLFGGRQSRGSGNQWRNPMDGRTSRKHVAFAFAWDGKSTLAKSLSIPLTMIAKAIEQAGGERPMIGLRWYKNEALEVARDWVAVNAYDFSEVLEAANKMAAIEQAGCLTGVHLDERPEGGGIPTCQACGLAPYERAN